MRRLPVYFLLDVSESMIGENHNQLQKGLSDIVRNLKQDPYALESVFLSVIAFAGQVKTVAPLTEILNFYPPQLGLGGGTSLGEALNHLMTDLDKNLIRSSREQKGDWKPIIFLMTDGKPTDKVEGAIGKWKTQYEKRAYMVAIGLGAHADLTVLKRLTNNVFQLEDQNPREFQKFIQWVSASVVNQSQSVQNNQAGINLAKADEDLIKLIDDVSEHKTLDPDYVILDGRCSRKHLPYLLKYERVNMRDSFPGARSGEDVYQLDGCYPLTEEYFDWSDMKAQEQKVNVGSLYGVPGCPHCGNSSTIAMCACGNLMCLNGPGEVTCPWCQQLCIFEANSGLANFEVTRSKG